MDNQKVALVGGDLPAVDPKDIPGSLSAPFMSLVHVGKADDGKWLGSSRVFDCVVLTIVVKKTDGAMIRAMAHYNPIGASKDFIQKFLTEVREGEPDLNTWEVNASYKDDRLGYVKRATDAVFAVEPDITVYKRKFTPVPDTKEISVYMAPDGELSAAGTGGLKTEDLRAGGSFRSEAGEVEDSSERQSSFQRDALGN